MSILILQSSDKTIPVPFAGSNGGYPHTLFVEASTDFSPLTYQWYKDNVPLDKQTSNTYSIAAFDQSLDGGVYKCDISNSNNETISVDNIIVEQLQLWQEGQTSSLLPFSYNTNFYGTQDVYVQGGLHVYTNTNELCNSDVNYSRLKPGQLAIVKTPTQTTYYQFVRQDPITYTRAAQAQRVLDRAIASRNAANWKVLEPGSGQGATAEANISLVGAVTSITLTDQGSNYLPTNTFVGLSSHSGIHTGTAFGNCSPRFDLDTNSLTSIRVTGATGYTEPPLVLIFSGTIQRYPDSLASQGPPWVIGVDWVERPLLAADVDSDTIQIVDNQLIAAGTPPDDKTIVIQDGVLSAVPYDQDLNTFNSVNFHDVTTNVVIENTMAIQTHTYATSSTVGRNSLSAVNNKDAAQGPYNVLEVNTNSTKYIPLDLTRANTFLLTLSDVDQQTGTYDGFVLINKVPLTSSFDVPLAPNTTYQTFIEPNSLKGKIYTITLFVKHLRVMSILPLKLYKGELHTGPNSIADTFSVTEIPVKWSAGAAPALYQTPSSGLYQLGSEDVIMYTTYDAGATWYGFIGGTDLR